MLYFYRTFIVMVVVISLGWVTGCDTPPNIDIPPIDPPVRATPSGRGLAVSPTLTNTTELSSTNISPTPTITPSLELPETTPSSDDAESDLTSAAEDDLPAGSQQPLQAAVTDLAEHLNLSTAVITVVSVEAVEWSDASLGCPADGVMYAQVITPGYQIVLEADGQRYNYHTNTEDYIIRCEL